MVSATGDFSTSQTRGTEKQKRRAFFFSQHTALLPSRAFLPVSPTEEKTTVQLVPSKRQDKEKRARTALCFLPLVSRAVPLQMGNTPARWWFNMSVYASSLISYMFSPPTYKLGCFLPLDRAAPRCTKKDCRRDAAVSLTARHGSCASWKPNLAMCHSVQEVVPLA